MTTVYLAYSATADDTLDRHAVDGAVDLLVAYPELDNFLRKRERWNIRQWVLDSGAFSVFNAGKSIDVDEYIEACRSVEGDALEIFGLDVIGDHIGTRRNNERMWEAGIDAIPTFHIGEPWEALEAMMHRPKVALGGVARGAKGRNDWLLQCVARAWPKRIHGFGLAGRNFINLLPFHSVDASSWAFAPARCGNWAGYTGKQVHLHGTARVKGNKLSNDFWIEVLEHQRRARWAAWRWRKQLAELEALP